MNAKVAFDLIRPHNCIAAGVAVLIAGIIATRGIPPIEIAFAITAAIIITGAGNAINDYIDRETDAVNNPERPIPSGDIKPSQALLISRILFVTGIIITIFTKRISCLIIAGLNSGLLSYYSRSLKNKGLIGNLAIGYLVGSTFLFGSLAVGKLETVGILAIIAAFSTAGRELIKDIEDIEGDQKSGSKSFPLKHGEKKAAALAIIFTTVAIAMTPIPYIREIFSDIYLYVVMVPIIVFLVGIGIISKGQTKKDANKASLTYKIGMALGLIAFLIGALY